MRSRAASRPRSAVDATLPADQQPNPPVAAIGRPHPSNPIIDKYRAPCHAHPDQRRHHPSHDALGDAAALRRLRHRLANHGATAITRFTQALIALEPFDLVCLDIQMPEIDGHAMLHCLRAIESAFGREGRNAATILMVTNRNDPKSVFTAFRGQCEGYIIKPLDRNQLVTQLAELRIVPIATGD